MSAQDPTPSQSDRTPVAHGKDRPKRSHQPVRVSVSIDTEEDEWGTFHRHGASVRNILELHHFQEVFMRWGVRPTYLVNLPPLEDTASVEVLGSLAERPDVEIGAHCHPWNTPPFGSGSQSVMMCNLTEGENVDKIGTVLRRLSQELGVDAVVFRAGKWSVGPTVTGALAQLRIPTDCSVVPLWNWSTDGGFDHTLAPREPYRFDPAHPFREQRTGPLLQLPVTVGFLTGGKAVQRARVRNRLERLPRLGLVGLLDRANVLSRRWLSPESTSGSNLVKLATHRVESGSHFLHLTLHSSNMLPGATPFVRDMRQRAAFLHALDTFFGHCVKSGYVFSTLREASLLHPSVETVGTQSA